MRHALLCTILFANATTAQELFVPSAAATADSNSAMLASGCNAPTRWLTIIDASHLVAMQGSDVTEIAFRRDAANPYAFDGGTATITVVMSHAPHDSVGIRKEFDSNHDPAVPNRITTFQGQLTLPASSAPASRTVGWSQPEDVLAIPFSTNFNYVSGPVCIEVTAYPDAGSTTGFWAIDAEGESSIGSVDPVEEPCGAYQATRQGVGASTVSVSPIELVPGSTARFTARGNPATTAAFLFGFEPMAVDLSWFGLGNPGCILAVNPVASVMATFVAKPPLPGGSATLEMKMSHEPTALGASFIIQALEFGIPIYTSEALHCQIAPQLPTLGMSFVTARIDGAVPTRGVTWTSRGPVVRFTHQ